MRPRRWQSYVLIVTGLAAAASSSAQEPPKKESQPDTVSVKMAEHDLKAAKDRQESKKKELDEVTKDVAAKEKAYKDAKAAAALADLKNSRILPDAQFTHESQANLTFILTFVKSQLTVEVKRKSKDGQDYSPWVRLEAEYAVSKDGMIFGIITYAGPEKGINDPLLAEQLQKWNHEPFAIRVNRSKDAKKLTVAEIRSSSFPAEFISQARGEYTKQYPRAGD